MKIVAMTVALLLAAGIAPAQATPQFDITGVWNSAGGGTIQIFQDDVDGDITALFVGPDFAHKYRAVYDANGTVTTGTVVRVVRLTGCSTKMTATYSIPDANTIYVNAIVRQATCGFAKHQQLTDVLTRIY
jgi:hypothetical protein